MGKSLWEQYCDGELPHIHISPDDMKNKFEDGASLQARRIEKNLKKAFPEKSEMEILNLMFSDVD